MKPQGEFTDEFGQVHAWSCVRNHYCVGISRDRAESLKRWAEAMKAAT